LVKKAEKWFEKAEKQEYLLAPAAFSYAQLLMLKVDTRKNKAVTSAYEQFEQPAGEYRRS
jgi:hypothetical protein